jgi:hypothetical protein
MTKKSGSAFRTSTACSCDAYSKQHPLVLSPDGQMFLGKKSPHFDFFRRRLFDPEGLGAEAGQFSKSEFMLSYTSKKEPVNIGSSINPLNYFFS